MTSWNDFVQKATNIANKAGFPVSVLLGQAALETGRGSSSMAQNKNNWFGTAAYDADPNKALTFSSPEDSINYYLKNIEKLVPNWQQLSNDPARLVQAIKNAGYASDPNYVQKVTSTPEFVQNSPTPSPNQSTVSNQPTPKPTMTEGEYISNARKQGSTTPTQDLMNQYTGYSGQTPNPYPGLVSPLPYDKLAPAPKPSLLDQIMNLVTPQAYGATSAQPITQPNSYTVRSGDTLWDIAQKQLGNGADWKQLGYTGNPNSLPVGTVLKLPSTQNYSALKPVTQPQASQINFTPGQTAGQSATLTNYQAPKSQPLQKVTNVPVQSVPKTAKLSNLNASFTTGGSNGYF